MNTTREIRFLGRFYRIDVNFNIVAGPSTEPIPQSLEDASIVFPDGWYQSFTGATATSDNYIYLFRIFWKDDHPAITEFIKESLPSLYNDSPESPRQAALRYLLEEPGLAEDGIRVAYTRNVDKLHRGTRTVTTLGKYLHRLFGGIVPDYKISKALEFWDAKTNGVKYRILRDRDMIDYMRALPKGANNADKGGSCMTGDSFSVEHHPYKAYASSLGWALAVVGSAENCKARCIIHEPTKIYSRVYARLSENLAEALERDGYAHCDDLHGYALALHGVYGDVICPYIDGDTQAVSIRNDQLIIHHNGELEANRTDGTAQYPKIECSCCNNDYDEEDLTSVDGEYICERCLGRYYVEIDGEYYHKDDDNIGCCEDCGEYYLSDDIHHAVGRDGYDRTVCEDCLDNNYTYCEDTQDYEHYTKADKCGACGDHYKADLFHDLCPECHKGVKVEVNYIMARRIQRVIPRNVWLRRLAHV